MNKSPFPGMDPYLEQAWRDVHQRLCVYACDDLTAQLGATGLIARIDERLVVELPANDERSIYPDIRIVERRQVIPPQPTMTTAGVALADRVTVDLADEAFEEGFIQIIDTRNGAKVITVIEFLSLTNKTPGESRKQYQLKQKELGNAGISLVEIDLLRAGTPTVQAPPWKIAPKNRTPYCAAVRRSWAGLQCDYFPLPLRQRLGGIPVPLRPGEPEAVLDLQSLIDRVYQNGAYAIDLDYSRPPVPPLEGEDAKWAEQVVSDSQAR